MKLGLSSYAYAWAIGVPGYKPERPLTLLDLLQKAIDLDVCVLQVADNLPLHTLSEPVLAQVFQKATRRDIQIEVGTRGIRPNQLQTYLRLAQTFQSSLVRVVVDTADHHPSLPEVIRLLKESLPTFVEAGVTLALENHDRFTVREFQTILETIDNPYLGICLDTVNSFGALEGPEVVIEALIPWTVNLHIKDFFIRRADHLMGFTIEGTPAGQGCLDIPHLLDKLTEHNRSASVILELWPPFQDNLADTIGLEDRWARTSVRYLRQLIKE